MKYSIQIIVLLFLASCSSEQDRQIHELVNGKNKWLEHSKQHDYSFIYKRQCFCVLNNEKIFIVVQKGKVISATAEDGEKINAKSLPTMKKLFKLIFETIKKQGWEKNITINVEYHPTLGYPSSIIIKRPVMDGNAAISISNMVLI